MYGLVNRAVEGLVTTRYGDDAWARITALAGLEGEGFLSMTVYPDELTYRLVGAAAEVTGLTAAEILEMLGRYWLRHPANAAYGDLLRMFGATLPEFLANLDSLHARLGLAFPRMIPPSFACTDQTVDSLILHYHSERKGLTPFVVGLLHGLAEFFDTPLTVEACASVAAGDDHDSFRLTFAR